MKEMQYLIATHTNSDNVDIFVKNKKDKKNKLCTLLICHYINIKMMFGETTQITIVKQNSLTDSS